MSSMIGRNYQRNSVSIAYVWKDNVQAFRLQSTRADCKRQTIRRTKNTTYTQTSTDNRAEINASRKSVAENRAHTKLHETKSQRGEWHQKGNALAAQVTVEQLIRFMRLIARTISEEPYFFKYVKSGVEWDDRRMWKLKGTLNFFEQEMRGMCMIYVFECRAVCGWVSIAKKESMSMTMTTHNNSRNSDNNMSKQPNHIDRGNKWYRRNLFEFIANKMCVFNFIWT